MKYDFICNGMWTALKKGFIQELSYVTDKEYATRIMKKAKNEYKQIISRTEGIGGIKHNPLTINFINCAMLIAIYKAASDKLSMEDVGEVYLESMRKNRIVKMFMRKDIFTEKWQKKRKAQSEKSKERQYKNDWVGIFVHGKDITEFGLDYSECGICKLCAQEGCFELAKQMCRYDFISAELMGAKLKRTKTIADGNGICDFWFEKKV